ncbi:MAG: hypothetical protein DMG07_04610 [Acidobacteria bacterium]|nr:MAG: hypothetical protein DMG07_04610 [Acidobacteriota bacterium]
MNPDVARALGDIRDRGLLTESRAALLQRIYEGKLVSVLPELRVLLYGGVVLAAAGAGLLVKDNFHRIGPAAVAVALALAVAGCFLWIARVAPPFDWHEVPPPNLAFDYILLLAVLLTGTELAFVETQFTPLGPSWPWHLLIMSLLSAAVAFRFDSRAVFSLALGSFAAWRGFSTAEVERGLWFGLSESVRLNAIACGLLFVLLSVALSRGARKAHFAPVAQHLGWLLFFVSVLTGTEGRQPGRYAFMAVSAAFGAGLAAFSYTRRDFVFFAYGVLGVYFTFVSLILHLSDDIVPVSLWLLIGTLAAVVWLYGMQKRMREPT